jgi:hypothetical protein
MNTVDFIRARVWFVMVAGIAGRLAVGEGADNCAPKADSTNR